VDGSHGRASQELRQRHSDGVRWNTRKRPAHRIGKAIPHFIDTHNLSPKGVTLTPTTSAKGIVAFFSIFIKEPQFQGQTKDRLNNPEVTAVVDNVAQARARALAESQQVDGRRRSSRASSWPRAPARRAAPRRPKSCARARPRLD
jgi:DNA gyrase subunit B/topoisomerase-4 subunit B